MGGRGAARRESTRTPTGISLSDYQRMDMLAMGRLFQSLDGLEVPEELNDNLIQKLVYGFGMNGKPEIVSDEELAEMAHNGAQLLYRSVSEDKYHDEFLEGDLTWMGEGVFGDGLYFSSNLMYAKNFGPTRIRAVLNKNAKVVEYDDVKKEQERIFNEADEYTKKNQGIAPHEDLTAGVRAYHTLSPNKWVNNNASAVALHMGYNVIHVSDKDTHNGDSYVVLDRSAMTVGRSKVKNPGW